VRSCRRAQPATCSKPAQSSSGTERLFATCTIPRDSFAGAHQFDSDITCGRHPRAALGTSDDELIALVCDGRRTGIDVGLTLAELAEYMADLGARHAINLDGGGSTALITTAISSTDPTTPKTDRAATAARSRQRRSSTPPQHSPPRVATTRTHRGSRATVTIAAHRPGSPAIRPIIGMRLGDRHPARPQEPG
jgi:hypothetical protein